ncbi:MAG TPA: diacylglycerol kinase family protein [Pseudothermotoga sp.]|nr:diacylglycerol kinase family protein [Pseudothermotoga sp.]HOK83159.1 diacylglycerol kinase family protein [Pseudothermotoga sp.]HPP69670.1 diacylglycerol kinase family protein [Pseudothermotoga sp.]
MKIGLVCNSASGRHADFSRIWRLLVPKLSGHELFCTYATAQMLTKDMPYKIVGGLEVHKTQVDSVIAGRVLTDVDFLLVLGGDGTISDVVYGQHMAGKMVPIAGIALGTINAGPLITIRNLEDLARCTFDTFSTEPVAAIEAYTRGDLVGVAFNDIVFSDCTVSTVNGQVRTVEAKAFLDGRKVVTAPKSIGTPETTLQINDRNVEIPFRIGQIIASPLHQLNMHQAKALSGKLCWAPFLNKHGAMIVSDQPIIRIIDYNEFDVSSPLLIAQFIFDESDVIRIANTKGFVVVDGNPRLDMEVVSECELRLNRTAAMKCVFQ